MKAAHINGGSQSFEREEQQRKVPIGLDKSWESRRVEGLELMVLSLEQQQQNKKSSCNKPCPHGNHQHNNNSNACCGNHHHHHHHHGNNGMDNNFVLSRHQEKSRSLSGLKKNKLSSTMSAPQKSLIFDSLTHVEGSSIGRKHKHVVHADVLRNACMTPDNFKVRELEQQVLDLIHQLAQEKHQARQDKLNLSKLQQQLARTKSEKPVKEMLMNELEQEKRRRELLEQKLKDQNMECCCQNQMAVLKKENTRLNEVVQDLLPYKNKVERLKQTNASSAAFLEAELHRLRSQSESLEQDNSLTNMELRKLESIIKNCQECRAQLVGQIRLDGTSHSETTPTTSSNNDSDKAKVLLERLKNLEAEKSSLVLENEVQFRHYEECLEDVTNQILDTLLVQKTLKEECFNLKSRVSQLEEENHSLKKFQSISHTSAVLKMNNHSASSSSGFYSKHNFNQSDDDLDESRFVIGHSVSKEITNGEKPSEDEEEDGCQSSLSLNEILDSAAGCTDVEEGIKSRTPGSQKPFFDVELSRNSGIDQTATRMKMSKSNSLVMGAGEAQCQNNPNVFVDMSLSDSFALLGNCSCSTGQFVHLGQNNSSSQNCSDVNSNTIAKCELIPPHKQIKLPPNDLMGRGVGQRKVFRGDLGWKKFLPVGCTSPQEEKDEGYLSNKTSEGSSDVSNHFVSQLS